MAQLVIRGGQVVDGTGAAARQADIAIEGGRITKIGVIDVIGDSEIDATGKVVCPGFVDPHTHYDAQLFWDPLASPSNLHGVTTIMAGNCGFTLAPIRPGDENYIRPCKALFV